MLRLASVAFEPELVRNVGGKRYLYRPTVRCSCL